MLNAGLLLVALLAGYTKLKAWIAVPAVALAMALLTLPGRPGKAPTLYEGEPRWQVFLTALPLYAVYALVLYALGYSLRALVS